MSDTRETPASPDFTLFRDRLLFSLERAGITQTELARAIGATPQAVQHMVKRDKPFYRGGQATKMAAALDVSVSWLAYKEGPPPEGDANLKSPENKLDLSAPQSVSARAASSRTLSMEGLSSLQTAGLEALAELMRANLFGDAEVIDLLHQLKPELGKLRTA